MITRHSFSFADPSIRLCHLGGLLALGAGALVAAPREIEETQAVLAEWIQVEKQISSDQNDWAVEKAVLGSAIEFMQIETARLQEIIDEAEETASAGERRRTELEAEKESLEAVSEAVSSVIGTYEARIQSLVKTWPDAFVKMVETPLSRIPEGEEVKNAALSMRLQNVIVILSQFDKFNAVVTKQKGIQEIDGTSREVTTLYYGASFAYFIDGAGEHAGYGMPSIEGEGWDWVADTSIAEDVQLLVAMYEQVADAQFVGLPARIVTP